MVPEPELVRRRLLAAGAHPGFAGRMTDVRYDRDGELTARGEVLRMRTYHDANAARTVIGWKGPVSVSALGLKEREELEYAVESAGFPPGALLEALRFAPVQIIERHVECYSLGTTVARLEWYPRMDALIEIEGDLPGIERGIQVTGLPRETFSPEPLLAFTDRYAARTGRPAALRIAELGEEIPQWPSR